MPGDLLVFNDTRVLKARLLGRKPTGGRVEALIERVVEPTLALAMVRTSHKPQPGAVFLFDDARATVEGRRGEFFLLRFDADVERGHGARSATFRCRRTSRTPTPPKTRSGTRPSTRRARAPSRRRPRDCTSRRNCSTGCAPAASSSRR